MRRVISNFFERLDIPKSVWVLFGFAILLRVWGIWYGLPLQLNVDEPSLVSGVTNLKNNLNPQRFDWPSLYFYITALFYGILVLLKPVIVAILGIPSESINPTGFFILSRLLSVIFGSLTVLVVFLIGREIFSKRVGFLSALILSVLPIHVYESHLAKVDIAHTFFIAIAVYFIYRIYRYGTRSAYLWSGFWLGIATSIKYNAFLLAVPILIAYLMRRSESKFGDGLKKWIDKREITHIFYALILSVVVFYIGTPYALLDSETFFSTERGKGAMWQFQNIGTVETPKYVAELYETFVPMYRVDLGIGLWIVFSLVLILFLFFNKRSKQYIFLLLPTILGSFYISRFDRSPSHYFLMLIPLYVPAMAAFLIEIIDKINRSKLKFSPSVFIIVLLLPSLWLALKSDIMLSRADTRNLAYNWVQNNLKEEDFLFVNGEELAVVTFKKNETKKIKKVDQGNILHKATPFYVLIGEKGITKEMLTTGDRDPEKLEGNSEPILKYAELVFTTDNKLRFGPPIHIFKVEDYIEEGEKD